MWLHLAVDKESVMSFGGLVLTVGELTCFFLCTAVKTKFGFPKAGLDDESVGDLRPLLPQPQEPPPTPIPKKYSDS